MRGVMQRVFGGAGPVAVQPWHIALRDVAVVVVLCSAAGGLLNLVRSDSIPFIQRDDYEILVPCPETSGEAEALEPNTPLLRDSRALVVDARSAQEYEKWHVPLALHVVFDYLEPTSQEAIRRIASSGAREVVVYGDGQDPDSGEQLARELSGKGIRNVRFVRGGALAISADVAAGGPPR